MIDCFLKDTRSLFDSSQPLLLAVSGGVDSSVLCHLVNSIGQPFAIAHCNFHLRPQECDRDELFVQSLAQQYKVDYYVAHFATVEYATQNSLSIEEAARELRYTFFDEILQGHHNPKLLGGQPVSECDSVSTPIKPQLIATAHHRDDATETFFINLLRGSGISGLHGILAKKGTLVRPMLRFGRKEILTYAHQNNISFVEDSTNSSDAYLRNKIRHQLMPLLRQVAPQVDDVMQANIQRLSEVETLYYEQVRYQLREFHLDPMRVNSIDIRQLRNLHPQRTLLFELLKDFRFTPSVIDVLLTIINNGEQKSGRQLYSATHRLLIDRTKIFLYPKEMVDEVDSINLELTDCLNYHNTQKSPYPELRFSIVDSIPTQLRLPPSQVLFDIDKVSFPLVVRRWKEGDRFIPFGMKGSQLVSDYFSNQKFSLLEKAQTWILTNSNDQILWIVGFRASDIAKVTTQTKQVIKVTIG